MIMLALASRESRYFVLIVRMVAKMYGDLGEVEPDSFQWPMKFRQVKGLSCARVTDEVLVFVFAADNDEVSCAGGEANSGNGGI